MLAILSSTVVMQFLKKFVVAFLALLLLISLFLWALTKTISPDAMRDFVRLRITALTGQPSDVKGTISWQLFPHPGIKIKNICIGNKNEPNLYTINLGQLLFNLKISALLQGKI